jgi:hypothetical protein
MILMLAQMLSNFKYISEHVISKLHSVRARIHAKDCINTAFNKHELLYQIPRYLFTAAECYDI